jgi:hypothetical protein
VSYCSEALSGIALAFALLCTFIPYFCFSLYYDFSPSLSNSGLSLALQSMWKDVMGVLTETLNQQQQQSARQAEMLSNAMANATAAATTQQQQQTLRTRSQSPSSRMPTSPQPQPTQPAAPAPPTAATVGGGNGSPLSDDLVLHLLTAACLRSEVETRTTGTRPLRELVTDVWESQRALKTQLKELELGLKSSMESSSSHAETLTTLKESTQKMEGAIASIGEKVNSTSTALNERLEAGVSSLQQAVSDSATALADGLAHLVERAKEEMKESTLSTAEAAKSEAIKDLVPSLAMLADELNEVKSQVVTVVEGQAAIREAGEKIDTLLSQGGGSSAIEATANKLSTELSDVARSVDSLETQVKEVMRLLTTTSHGGKTPSRMRSSSAFIGGSSSALNSPTSPKLSPAPAPLVSPSATTTAAPPATAAGETGAPPPVPASPPPPLPLDGTEEGPLLGGREYEAAEEEEEAEESVSAGQIFPLPDDALRTNAALEEGTKAATIVGFYAVPTGRNAAEAAYNSTSVGGAVAAPPLLPGSTASSGRASASSLGMGMTGGSTTLPRLALSTATLRSTAAGAASALAAADVDAAELELEQFDVAELSAGEVVLSEEVVDGQKVRLIPITMPASHTAARLVAEASGTAGR